MKGDAYGTLDGLHPRCSEATVAPQWTMSYMGALVYLALFGSGDCLWRHSPWSDALVRGKSSLQYAALPLVALSISTVWFRLPRLAH